jgi:hypothetical protein
MRVPLDYGPILLLKPFGFRIAPDTLSSGKYRKAAPGKTTDPSQNGLVPGDLLLMQLMLTVLGGLSEFERELIRGRTSKGRARVSKMASG